MYNRKLIGHIGVDAGLCWVGDPCYILHTDTPPKAIGKNWGDFCNGLTKYERGMEISLQHKSYNYDNGHEGLGVVVGTGWGDGSYPVYAEFEHGRVARITVDFMPLEEDEEDEDEE